MIVSSLQHIFGRFKLQLNSKKSEAIAQKIVQWPVPPTLHYPLWLKQCGHLEPCVATGSQVYGGQILARNDDKQIAIYAASSGIVTAITKQAFAHPSQIDVPSITLSTDGQHHWHKHGEPGEATQLSSSEISSRLQAAGLLGLGGAAFPSLKKLTEQPTKVLIINAVECEPYINCDSALMQNYANQLIEALHLLNQVISSPRIIIAIEANKPNSIQELRSLTKDSPIEIAVVPVEYPNGASRILIQQLTGQAIAKGKHASDSGILCYNVATLFAMWEAIVHQRPLTHRITTLAGDAISQPLQVDLLFGTPLSYIMQQLNLTKAFSEYAISQGGNMMGLALHADSITIQAESNCLLIHAKEQVASKPAAMACINCLRCVDVCPVKLEPQQLFRYGKSSAFKKMEPYNLKRCIECGLCDAVCPSFIPLSASFKSFKDQIKSNNQNEAQRHQAKIRFEERNTRLERLTELKAMQRRLKQEKLKASQNKAPDQKQDKKAQIMAAVRRAKAKKAQVD